MSEIEVKIILNGQEIKPEEIHLSDKQQQAIQEILDIE